MQTKAPKDGLGRVNRTLALLCTWYEVPTQGVWGTLRVKYPDRAQSTVT